MLHRSCSIQFLTRVVASILVLAVAPLSGATHKSKKKSTSKPKAKHSSTAVAQKQTTKHAVQKRSARNRAKSPVNTDLVARQFQVRNRALNLPQPAPALNPISPLDLSLSHPQPTCALCSRQLLTTAYSLIGSPYRLGASSPEKGFDCSGFVKYVYKTSLDVPLPPNAPSQFQYGEPVEKSALQEGDLVFFRNRQRGWHVGIYVGQNMFIHSPNRRKTVTVSPLDSPYFRKAYVGARRVMPSDNILITEDIPSDSISSTAFISH